MIEDFCPTYTPGPGGVCLLCGRTFEEQCAQFGFKAKSSLQRIEDMEQVHKPWCHCIAKLGDNECNCLQPGQKELLMRSPEQVNAREVKECERWRESVSGNCICGLPWAQHSLKARNGWLTKESYKPAQHADDALMSNEEAAKWVLSLGPTNAKRIEKIQELLVNAVKDNMSEVDRIFLEQTLKVLELSAPTVEQKGTSLHPCAECMRKLCTQSGQMCKECREEYMKDTHEREAAAVRPNNFAKCLRCSSKDVWGNDTLCLECAEIVEAEAATEAVREESKFD